MNLAPIIGVYGIVCRENGKAVLLPGGSPYVTRRLDGGTQGVAAAC